MNQRPNRKTRIGIVTSNSMDKTVVVSVERHVRHPLYGKSLKKTSKLKAHDGSNESGVGDIVKVMETRPISKGKRWRVIETLKKAELA